MSRIRLAATLSPGTRVCWACAAWIEDYNHRRRHTACQKMPPVIYEQLLAQNAEQAA